MIINKFIICVQEVGYWEIKGITIKTNMEKNNIHPLLIMKWLAMLNSLLIKLARDGGIIPTLRSPR